MGWIAEITRHVRNLLTQPTDELTQAQRALLYGIDMARYAARTLHDNRATQMAAALTYRTIFSLIPLFVLALIAFRAFGGFEVVGQNVQQRMYTYMGISALAYPAGDTGRTDVMADDGTMTGEDAGAMRERLDSIITQLTTRVSQVSFGSIGVVGVVLLIWAALALVVTVEHCFNTVYNSPSGRPWHMRIAIYWAVITLGPVLLVVSLSLAGGLVRWADVRGEQQKSLDTLLTDMDQLHAMARSEGGPIEQTHTALMSQLQNKENPLRYVRRNLTAIEAAGDAMFSAWQDLAAQYRDESLKKELTAQLSFTHNSFDKMVQQMKRREPIPGLGPFVAFLSRGAALFASWLLLFLLYLLMPNTHVALRPAAIGAITAAILWELAKWGFNLYVTHAVPFSKVYGSLGLIPLFLFWLYLTWLIVLFGIEVTYILQTLPDFRKRQKQQHQQARLICGNPMWLIPILTRLGQRFDDGQVTSADQLADELGLPVKSVTDICHELEKHNLLNRVNKRGRTSDAGAYSLARSPRLIRMADLMQLAFTLCRTPGSPENPETSDTPGTDSWRWLESSLKQHVNQAGHITLAQVIDAPENAPQRPYNDGRSVTPTDL